MQRERSQLGWGKERHLEGMQDRGVDERRLELIRGWDHTRKKAGGRHPHRGEGCSPREWKEAFEGGAEGHTIHRGGGLAESRERSPLGGA
ncbi:hypothetical protein GOP47_0005588 [Adiantum capillus-veneris]|uniref:Uncharacterized protein n=1 Tax=Adiantum capillus-veneris TaxID=13818 RepID=A0A9D4ZLQ5_ADICA|nr:hypothetical protein GOP47_0005588 [Adiantum capillus-veneris]